MTWESPLIWLVGLAAMCSGFLVRPRSSFDLLHPRFVVPIILWSGTFAQAILRSSEEIRESFYENTREAVGVQALMYSALAIVMFQIGLMLPFGRSLAQPLKKLDANFVVDFNNLRRWAWIVTLALLFAFIAIEGTGRLGIPFTPSILQPEGTAARVVTVLFTLGSIFSSAMLGWSVPPKHERMPWTLALVGLGLFINCLYTMPIFSRGTGLPVVVGIMAYYFRHRRVGIIGICVAYFWMSLCSNTGLSGRVVYGRDSDAFTFLSHAAYLAWERPGDILFYGIGINDGFTTLAVSMHGSDLADVRPLSKLQWLLFQIPIPRVAGIHPEWTVDLTLYIGGYGTWGFTTGILGDLYIHWKWAGVLWFVLLGVLYRMMSSLALGDSRDRSRVGGLSPYMLALVAAYYALGMGMFNTFRSWVVTFLGPLVAVVLFLMLHRLFTGNRNQAMTTMDDQQFADGEYEEYEPELPPVQPLGYEPRREL